MSESLFLQKEKSLCIHLSFPWTQNTCEDNLQNTGRTDPVTFQMENESNLYQAQQIIAKVPGKKANAERRKITLKESRQLGNKSNPFKIKWMETT